MDPFHFISHYFWAIGIAFALFHYIKNQYQLKAVDNDNTLNVEIRNQYARWFSLAAVFPWVVMGWGQVVGNVPSIWYYFRPQDQNPYVVAWFVLNFLLVVAFTLWVFFADGARKAREYDLFSYTGMSSKSPVSETTIKLLAAIGPVFFLFWVYLVSTMDATIPK